MSSGVKVSVIIPNYEYDQYILNAIQSVANSSLRNIEIIVVDSRKDLDGVKFLESFLRHLGDSRVKLVRVGPQKPGANRNLGILNSSGSILCTFDPDDFMHPFYLEVALFRLLYRRLDVSGAATWSFGLDSGVWKVPERATGQLLRHQNCLASDSIFTRELWQQIGGFVDSDTEIHIHEDWRFWHRASRIGAALGSTPAPLTAIRKHGKNLSWRQGIPPRNEQARIIRRANSDINFSLKILMKKVFQEFFCFSLTSEALVQLGNWIAVNCDAFTMLVGHDIEILLRHAQEIISGEPETRIIVCNLGNEIIANSITRDFQIWNLRELIPLQEMDVFVEYLKISRKVDKLILL